MGCGDCYGRETEESKLRKRVEELELLLGEAYQAVGTLASDCGRFEDPTVVKMLDNLSEMKMVHDDALPLPSKAVDVASAGLAGVALESILKWVERGADELLVRRIWDDARRAVLEESGVTPAVREWVFQASRRNRPRRSWVHENPDGTRRMVSIGCELWHRKTRGKYVLTSFSHREKDMEFGFEYISATTFEKYWRPIAELFDGRFVFSWAEGEALAQTCEHKRQKWNPLFTSGTCQDCGETLKPEEPK